MFIYFRGKRLSLNAYSRKEEMFKINDLRFHVKKLGKEEQLKTQAIRNGEIKKIRAAITEIVNRKTMEKLMKPKVYSFKSFLV